VWSPVVTGGGGGTEGEGGGGGGGTNVPLRLGFRTTEIIPAEPYACWGHSSNGRCGFLTELREKGKTHAQQIPPGALGKKRWK